MTPTPDGGPGTDQSGCADADGDGVAVAGVDDLERMLDAAVEGVVVFDDAGQVQSVSDAVASLLGRDSGSLVDSPVETLLLEGAAAGDRVDIHSAGAFRSQCLGDDRVTDVDVALAAADGTVLRATVSTVPLSARECTACLVHEVRTGGRDRIPERYRDLVHSAGDPMYAVDSEGRIRWVNDATAGYTGYDRDELLGRHVSDLVAAREYEQVTERLVELVGSDRAAETLEVTVLTSDGGATLTEAKLMPLTDDDGGYAGSVGMLRDITDRKERERDLELLKRVLTRVFRHNVRNELTIIQGRAELVRLDDSSVTAHADAIIESTERLFDHSEKARLIERVLETQHLVDADVSRLVDQAVRSVTWAHPDATVETEIPAGATIEAHPEFDRAVEELVENAIVHAPADRPPHVEVWLEEREDHHTLYIEDDSGGLADYEFQVLREGAETDLEHGSGVGLWLVYWLVEASGAELLASRTETGTLMGIRFSHR